MRLLETAFGMGSRKVLVTPSEYEGYCNRRRAEMAQFSETAWEYSRAETTPSNIGGKYNEFHRNSLTNCCYFVFVAKKFWQK